MAISSRILVSGSWLTISKDLLGASPAIIADASTAWMALVIVSIQLAQPMDGTESFRDIIKFTNDYQ